MVQIPTARDVGRVGTRSGRIAPSGPTVNVGEGIAQFGNALTQVAYDLNDLRTQEAIDNQQKVGFDLETKIAQFRDAEEQAFNKAREEASESGIGFTRQFIESYQERANAFGESNFAGLDDAQKARAKQSIMGLGNSLYGKAYDYEQKSKTLFYDRTTNQGLDTVRTQIKNNAAPYEELKRQGLAAINAAAMPEAWKAERRALWESDAAESKWQWKFGQNPKEAISQVSAPSGSNVGRAYQRLISKGWAPHQAAGIVGNLMAESGRGLNTQARNAGDGSDGSDSIGVAQWNGARAKALKNFAAAQGKDWHDIDVQTDFIDHELRTSERAAGENLARSQNAEEAAAAFVGYERPAGWSPSNARGAMHWEKRRDAALQIAGENPSAEDADLEAIPYDRREQLAAWGESQYNQQIVQQRTAAKDGYNLLIATQPDQVQESVILQDPLLDNGDKASLINSLNAARKENAGVSELIGAIASGNASINPFDPAQTKVADKAYEKMLAAATTPEQQAVVMSGFVAGSGYVPKKVQAELRRGAASTNPAEVAQSMQAASVLQKNAPISFNGFEGGDTVRKNLDLYRTYTEGMGLSPDEAGRKIIDLNDPEKVRQRDAILKSEPVKKVLKDISASDVAAIFDKGFWHAAPDVGGIPSQEAVKVGVNTEAEAAIVADYRGILEESIAETGGDMDAARELANTRFSRNYGVSELSPLGSSVVIKYPPEKVYPAAPDGTHDYIREQTVEALKAEGVTPEAIYLQPYGATEEDIRAGRPARYQVFYEQDGKLQSYFLPFVADPEQGKVAVRAKQEQQLRDAKTRMIENRDRFTRERAVDQRSYDETQGSDWMKARQMQADQERRRQDEALERLRGENPVNVGPMNGGGGGGY
ncbi:hypothetical protein GOA89_11570 [Sinorhizobium meliloti]|nr:hypothetical protein [Sinorhizobium meliloti]MDW9846941.1 hypothetical protein [Sinorhizobium meliloti]MDX0143745.1 hypothetical protein [Sinorhizobium meliloti]MDX0149770.1 hypothetical protein [Sinorhizobium meliloti]MDX0168955.1 hypothetical protein [Sinorhizobium meliloti]